MNTNPFSGHDSDRRAIWDMLVYRDIMAFLQEDWAMVADDFIEDGFIGLDAGRIGNPDAWRLGFPTLNAYREEWLRQAAEFKTLAWGEDIEAAMFRVTVLRDVEIKENVAVVHKKFFGSIVKADGSLQPMNWQTLYYCRKVNHAWKITGFTGYMPHFIGETSQTERLIKLPSGAGQHQTAGPYSPVLEIDPGKLVVLSGQAAIDPNGNVVGNTIEEQAAYTMDNCLRQLISTGCGFNDVFKVNVYLKNLEDWPRFNEVYREYFTGTLPVRTALKAGLLMNLLIEIEMWAVKS
ncbi:RidA family protein [Agriterribacter sp.]|uniref:RidA family protein n=1 Tax=Agriterribacter sp. TaxID=2821509 RepID=UPI002CA6FC6E|nr:RidA family protein [Agriterribacter sp.]HRP54440.1 RidA family protein [Agriterribacter sp.]